MDLPTPIFHYLIELLWNLVIRIVYIIKFKE